MSGAITAKRGQDAKLLQKNMSIKMFVLKPCRLRHFQPLYQNETNGKRTQDLIEPTDSNYFNPLLI